MHNIENKKCKVCFIKIPMPRVRDKIKEFCGRKCVAIFFGENKQKIPNDQKFIPCKNCNNVFKIGSGKQFCSKKCAGEFKRIVHKRNCKRCNKEFVLTNIAYEKRDGGRFCSIECATRKFEFDDKYFEKIDTNEKAYWLGFLFADGNVDNKLKQMTINLAYKDREHLEKLRIALNAEHTVKIYEDENFTDNKKATFVICSKKLSNDLCNLGCIPAKSLVIKYPKIESNFDAHFIRGFFDGDGCIYVNFPKRKKPTNAKNKKITIYCSSNIFIKKIHEILINIGITSKLYKRKLDRIGLCLEITRKNEIKKFFEYIYNESTIHLIRKYNKFII